MKLTKRSTPPLSLSRLFSVLVSLCAFAILPLPQISGIACSGTCEAECPFEEDGESSAKELVEAVSVRQRFGKQRDRIPRAPELSVQCRRSGFYKNRPLAIVGHQFFNGLCAPLVL